MWNTTKIDNLILNSGQSQNISFTYSGTTPIKLLQPSCGCTSLQRDGNNIQVTYTAYHLPPGIMESNFAQNVLVTFEDNSKQLLEIEGKILNYGN